MNVFFLLVLILSPFVGSILNGFFGFRYFKKYSGIIASSAIFFSFVSSLIILLSQNSSSEILLFEWIKIRDWTIANFSFILDHLSVIMSVVVSFVSLCVHIYSVFYMAEDEGLPRYFSYLNLFVFFMLLLVLSGNYLLFFVGWEGVGLCSYLLIGYWYKKDSASKAGVKAFVVNRVGDAFFLMGIFFILKHFHSLDYGEVHRAVYLFDNRNILFFIGLFLFIGAIGKSAQFPLYIWLPDAMEGPTPVSALIHAATMVTAGVYMVIRNSFLYALIPLELIAYTGAFTAFYAALCAIFEKDLKRILAYSTISQLGYMFIGAGLLGYYESFFHLITHAFFKALLFLVAGIIMHSLKGETNIFKMGGLKDKLKEANFLFLIGALALSGIPPTGGYFSKEEILLFSLKKGALFIFFTGTTTAFLTAFYIFRVYFLIFWAQKEKTENHNFSPGKGLLIPAYILAFFSLISGFLNIGGFLREFIGVNYFEHEIEYPYIISILPLFAALSGIYFAYFIYREGKEKEEKIEKNAPFLYSIIDRKFYWDYLVSNFLPKFIHRISYLFHSLLETKIIDGFVNGIGEFFRISARFFSTFHTGSIRFYLRIIFTGVLFLLWLYWTKIT